ncbi:hypothetical protein Dsin_022561 [Dipteronia sinensis]|uniref:Uncharacterized protein n=1 Tax=Dipteronia sinensis TaxID=43782 RepID=A0AAE0A380_9ROSI|nr:hypothetical protein Dsin_022561 [Dipteronia sinensis]
MGVNHNHQLNHLAVEQVCYTPTEEDIIKDITRQNNDDVVEINDDDDDSHEVPKTSTGAIYSWVLINDMEQAMSSLHSDLFASWQMSCHKHSPQKEMVLEAKLWAKIFPDLGIASHSETWTSSHRALSL